MYWPDGYVDAQKGVYLEPALLESLRRARSARPATKELISKYVVGNGSMVHDRRGMSDAGGDPWADLAAAAGGVG